ncbi:MAG: photosystem reaction center subunit H [Rhodospirillaceae bacterium]|nr:photosystem reaction center subunit H [Rhodospirillaceae bacterium]
MFWRFSSLRGQRLHATDGEIGKVDDFLFDDATWTIRYLVADTGGWLSGRRVLIVPASIGETRDGEEDLPVSLSKSQIENSPPVGSDQSVSRQHEEALHGHYGWLPYWSGAAQATGTINDERGDFGVPLGEAEEKNGGDPHLRSMSEVEDYHVSASDGPIGHVEDFLLDPEGWSVRYLLIDTRNWWPGKRVLVAPQWIDRMDWSAQEVHATLTRDRIKACPEFDSDMAINRSFEERLYRHYDKIPYWA